MNTRHSVLPLEDTAHPTTQDDVAAAVRQAFQAKSPMYVIGGGTSLDFGLPARTPGVGVILSGLNKIVDYPARDMTVTVEAGATMEALAEVLRNEGQRLPIDAPNRDAATLGGVLATNTSGPRRFGFGTMRDYVIGIRAVDGRGVPFRGGGRVVKNVAGYDFCKLLTGSLGTLGAVVEVTLKLKPQPESSVLIACNMPAIEQAEKLLRSLVSSRTRPCAVEWVVGPEWEQLLPAESAGALVVGLEGSQDEVRWMSGQLTSEWHEQGVSEIRTFADADAERLWQTLTEFPAAGDAAVTVKMSLKPNSVAQTMTRLQRFDNSCSVQAHAASGVLIAQFAEFSPDHVARLLVGDLQPAAAKDGGSCVILASRIDGLTRQAIWGPPPAALPLMRKVRDAFDPHHLLNPGRFVYD